MSALPESVRKLVHHFKVQCVKKYAYVVVLGGRWSEGCGCGCGVGVGCGVFGWVWGGWMWRIDLPSFRSIWRSLFPEWCGDSFTKQISSNSRCSVECVESPKSYKNSPFKFEVNWVTSIPTKTGIARTNTRLGRVEIWWNILDSSSGQWSHLTNPDAAFEINLRLLEYI